MNRRPTDEEVGLLFHHIGKGIWWLQYVEDALNTLLTLRLDIKTPDRVSAEEAESALAKRREGTLGGSLRTARENNLVPTLLLEHLTAFTEERNWLVHRSIDSHGQVLYTEAGRTETFERLEAFLSSAKILQLEIGAEIQRYSESHGIGFAKAEEDALKQIAGLRGAA